MKDDADLYQPTLQKYHDEARHARPWNLSSLVFAAFFCGPIGGGALVSLNFKHLGQPRTAGWSAFGFGLLTVSLIALTVYVRVNDVDIEKRMIRLGAQGLTLLAALVATRIQKPRFRAFIGHGGEPRPLFKIGLLAFVAGGICYFLLLWVGFAIGGAPLFGR